MLAQFIEQSKIDAEADKRIQSENAKLSVANIEKDNTIARQARQIDQYAGELQVLKDRASKYRNALEVARSSILAMRQQRNDDLDTIEQKTNEIAALDARISDLVTQNDEFARRYEGHERQIVDLKNDLDSQGKRETELRQSLAEANALLENETLRSQNNANELSAAQRELSQLNLQLTSARSEIETLRERGDLGASLQAEVTLRTASADDLALLESLGDDLRFVLITSAARVERAGSDAIEVSVSRGTKCERCWHYRDDVATEGEHAGICGRCVGNLTGAGESRSHA